VKQLNKLDGSIRKSKFKEQECIFSCPICGNKMHNKDYKDLVCLQGHSFNIAKTGYVNFLGRPPKTEYNQELFQARQIISESGFFKPLLECISQVIIAALKTREPENTAILDAGCGEGSHLGQIIGALDTGEILGVGIDIVKEAVVMASKSYFDIIWCVADLANLPFREEKFDVILNILSPANYKEFSRTLKDEGLLIKVVPGSKYLKELREVFYYQTEKQTYSNDKIIEHYTDNFKILEMRELLYTITLDKANLRHLIKMTPLSWTASEAEIEEVLKQEIHSITADFTVIIGKPSVGS
jgi:23S rRNA (guanine745-N1)-methyltransferase